MRQASNIAFFMAVVLVCFAPNEIAIVGGLASLLVGFVLSSEAERYSISAQRRTWAESKRKG